MTKSSTESGFTQENIQEFIDENYPSSLKVVDKYFKEKGRDDTLLDLLSEMNKKNCFKLGKKEQLDKDQLNKLAENEEVKKAFKNVPKTNLEKAAYYLETFAKTVLIAAATIITGIIELGAFILDPWPGRYYGRATEEVAKMLPSWDKNKGELDKTIRNEVAKGLEKVSPEEGSSHSPKRPFTPGGPSILGKNSPYRR